MYATTTDHLTPAERATVEAYVADEFSDERPDVALLVKEIKYLRSLLREVDDQLTRLEPLINFVNKI